MPQHSFILPAAAACLLLTGCGGDRTESYRIPKEWAAAEDRAPATFRTVESPDPEALPPEGAMPPRMQATPGMEEQVATIPEASWEAPSSWISEEAGTVRKGSYRVVNEELGMEGDLGITAFPGDVGGLAANINRWRNQIGLPPLESSRIEVEAAPMEVAGYPGRVVLILPDDAPAGTVGILGAVVSRQDHTWFFRLTGPAALLNAEHTRFVEFLQTVNFNGQAY